jgi:Tol biopolymer transport system component
VTTPCADETDGEALGLWSWSPVGARLVAVLGPDGATRLTLIDPATGDRTDLGSTEGEVLSMAWSPDGSRIAYATVPPGSGDSTRKGSVSMVTVEGGQHVMIADSLGQVPGGEEGAGIAWSPDGTQIAVLAGRGGSTGTLYIMEPDGSGRRLFAENVHIEHILGSPNIDWSPDGTRLAYATLSEDRAHLQIWSAALDGSDPVSVFDDEAHPRNKLAGGPVWSPDGARIAFRNDSTGEQHRWQVVNADGSGDVREIDALLPLSWRTSSYFCECYG